MSEAKWSPEPWGIADNGDVRDAANRLTVWGVDDFEVYTMTRADARRIVACVNALSGIPTEALEAGALGKALDAATWAHYCATCWDNPAHNLCEKHLDPLTAALLALGRLEP